MSNSTVDIQGQLVTIDNLLQGLNFLYEELSSRKEKLLGSSSIRNELEEVVSSYDYQVNLAQHIVRNVGSEFIIHCVAMNVQKNIDKDIEAFLENRIDKYLESKNQH